MKINKSKCCFSILCQFIYDSKEIEGPEYWNGLGSQCNQTKVLCLQFITKCWSLQLSVKVDTKIIGLWSKVLYKVIPLNYGVIRYKFLMYAVSSFFLVDAIPSHRRESLERVGELNLGPRGPNGLPKQGSIAAEAFLHRGDYRICAGNF